MFTMICCCRGIGNPCPSPRCLSNPFHSCSLLTKLFFNQDDDIERPLVSEDLSVVEDGISESAISYSIEGAARQAQGSVSLPHSVTVAPKRALSTSPQLMHSNSSNISPFIFPIAVQAFLYPINSCIGGLIDLLISWSR